MALLRQRLHVSPTSIVALFVRHWVSLVPDLKALRKRLKNNRSKYPDVVEMSITDRELLRLVTSACRHCGSTADICIDHVIPLARGGRTSVGNLQPLCRTCNMRKGGKLMIEFRSGKRISVTTWARAKEARALGKL